MLVILRCFDTKASFIDAKTYAKEAFGDQRYTERVNCER